MKNNQRGFGEKKANVYDYKTNILPEFRKEI